MTATVGRTVDFARRWDELSVQRAPLCLGIAPSDKWLDAWRLPAGIDGARDYCELVLSAAADTLAVVKVQVPFFARFGGPGLELLRWFTDRMHEQGTLVLLDAKLGDADDTMDSYAQLYLGPDSVLGGDAVTADCYLGFASIAPLLHAAQALGALVFVMVRTSNHAADDVQHAHLDGQPVTERLADLVTGWNAEHCGAGIGAGAAVVGARSPESAQLYRKLPSSLVEVPGLGRTNRDPDEIRTAARILEGRALFTVTTGVFAHGPDVSSLRASLAHWARITQD